MLDKIKEYYEREYTSTKHAIERNYRFATPREFVNRSITDCLAIAMFVQSIGVSYAEVNPLYMEIKERLENLLKE